jgi:hypothetical protein
MPIESQPATGEKPMKRWITATLLATARVAMTANSWAWTGKPIKLIVPAPAGGRSDVVPRMPAQQLSTDVPMPEADDIKGLLKLRKSRPGKASFASYAAGTS